MGETRHGSRRLYIDYPAGRQRDGGEREETLFRGTLQLPKLITAGASVPGIINPAGRDRERGERRPLAVLSAGMLAAIIRRDNKTDSR